jgi:hypothetical protein
VFEKSPMTAEQQKQKLNLEVSAIMRAMDLPESQRGDVRSAYVIAEDLALRQVEIEGNLLLSRHVVVEGVPFDAVAVKNDCLIVCEVVFSVKPEIAQTRIDILLDKVDFVNQAIGKIRKNFKMRLILAVITQLAPAEENALQSRFAKKFADTPIDADIYFFDFEQLQRTFLNG